MSGSPGRSRTLSCRSRTLRSGPDSILRGRKGEIHIPADLDGVVTGVFGLDQRRVARRLTGSGDSPPGPSPLRPEELEQRYNFPKGRGKGRTIAIAEFGGGYFPEDIRTFCEAHGRTAPEIEVVSVGAGPLTPAEITSAVAQQQQPLVGESHEVTMDVEIVRRSARTRSSVCSSRSLMRKAGSTCSTGWSPRIPPR